MSSPEDDSKKNYGKKRPDPVKIQTIRSNYIVAVDQNKVEEEIIHEESMLEYGQDTIEDITKIEVAFYL